MTDDLIEAAQAADPEPKHIKRPAKRPHGTMDERLTKEIDRESEQA